MWVKIKKLFGLNTPKPPQQYDTLAITMLQQIIKAHQKGRILFRDCETLRSQRTLLLEKGGELGLNNVDLDSLNKDIEKLITNVTIKPIKGNPL